MWPDESGRRETVPLCRERAMTRNPPSFHASQAKEDSARWARPKRCRRYRSTISQLSRASHVWTFHFLRSSQSFFLPACGRIRVRMTLELWPLDGEPRHDVGNLLGRHGSVLDVAAPVWSTQLRSSSNDYCSKLLVTH